MSAPAGRRPDPSAEHAGADRARVLGEGIAWTATWSLRVVAIALGAVLVGLIVGQLWSIFLPVFLGVIIASVLAPPVGWLRRRRMPSALATTLVVVVALAVLGGVVGLIAPSVAGQAPLIVQGAIGGLDQIQAWLNGPPFNLSSSQIGSYVQMATERLQQSATDIAGGVLTGVSAVAGGVINGVLALVLAFLFVKDGPRWLPWVRRMSGERAGGHLVTVMERSWARVGGFIRTQALIGVVDAVFIGVGLVIFGVPLALPLAVLTFFGAFIPIVGALVAGALAVLIALVVQGPGIALGVLILIIAVQQVEGNLLQPVLQGRGLGLHSTVVILAVTAGSSLFGIAGAFLAVPVAAVAAELLRYLAEQVDRRVSLDAEANADHSHDEPAPHTLAAEIGTTPPENPAPVTPDGSTDPSDGNDTPDGTGGDGRSQDRSSSSSE